MAGDSAVPPGSTIVAAWLYWETIWGDPTDLEGAQFRGQDLALVRGIDQPLTGSLSACWRGGGGSSGRGRVRNTLTMMRADVLSLLPLELDQDSNPTGRRLVNDEDLAAAGLSAHTVTLPERGRGKRNAQSAGASLVVVYRHAAEPLRKIVVFDGNYPHRRRETSVQRIRGFLQASVGGPGDGAQLTYLVGSGRRNRYDQISLGNPVDPTNPTRLVQDPFFRAGRGSVTRTWSSYTHDLTPLMAAATVADDFTTPEDDREYGEQLTTILDHARGKSGKEGGRGPYDCLAQAAIIFSTTVVDVDGDGIIDVQEDPSPFGVNVLADPNGHPYPDLDAMGAVVGQRDFFAEINGMRTDLLTTYGSALSGRVRSRRIGCRRRSPRHRIITCRRRRS